MRNIVRILCGVLLGCSVALTGARAPAQAGSTATEVAAAERGNLFRFAVDLRGDWTDNRDSAGEDPSGFQAVDEEDNFDFYVTPRIDLFLEQERTLFDFYYAPSYRYRDNPSDIQNDSEFYHDVGLNFRHRLTRQTTVRLGELFNYTDDPKVSESGMTVRDNQSYTLNRAELRLIQDLTARTSMDLWGANKIKNYDEREVADIADETRWDGGAMLRTQPGHLTAVSLQGQYSQFAYEGPFNRDFTLVYGGVGIEKILRPDLRAGINAGWQWIEYDADEMGEDDNPFGEVWIRGDLSPAAKLHLSGTMGRRDSDVYPYVAQKFGEGRCTLDYKLTEKLALGVTGVYRLSDYEEGVPQGLPEGDETTIELMGSASYQLARKTWVRISQHYDDTDSDVWNTYTKNTTSLVFHQEF